MLSAPIQQTLAPLLTVLPPAKALSALVVNRPHDAPVLNIVDDLIASGSIPASSPQAAALWLYVDHLDNSHRISQAIDNPTGAFWHGIMHRREGDFSNSHYWFRRAASHPAIALIAGYDPHRFIDDVEQAHRNGTQPAELIEPQRREWAGLYEWCFKQNDSLKG